VISEGIKKERSKDKRHLILGKDLKTFSKVSAVKFMCFSLISLNDNKLRVGIGKGKANSLGREFKIYS